MRASESDRAVDCPHSLVKIGKKADTEKAIAAREWGHTVHHWKETGRFRGLANHLATFRKKLRASGVDRNRYWRKGTGEHEVTFALRLDDLTLLVYDRLEEELDRDKWKEQFDPALWLTGTIDWLVWGDEDTIPWVDDLKTGHWPVAAIGNRQLLSYMLVPWVALGCPRDFDGVVSITQWEKYPLESLPVRRSWRVNAFDMLDHLENLRWAVDHPDEANVIEPEINARGWVTKLSPCTFCHNRQEFPASEWMTSWKFNRLPTCWEGALSMLRDGRLQPVSEEED